MRTRACRGLAALLMVGAVLIRPAAAQERPAMAQPITLAEATVSACASGAVIGVLLVAATGVGSASGTATLFCGLSAAATVTGAAVSIGWRALTGRL